MAFPQVVALLITKLPEVWDFEASTTEGRLSCHDWIGDSWAVLSSHPKDFTPICTTEPSRTTELPCTPCLRL
jgi:alkyl hydroperoxide reductase subunit AhpC